MIGLWLSSARSLDKQFSAYMMKETKRVAEAKAAEAAEAAEVPVSESKAAA